MDARTVAGRAPAKPEPVGVPKVAKLGPPAGFSTWSVDRRRNWLKVNRPDLTTGEDAEDRIAEWMDR